MLWQVYPTPRLYSQGGSIDLQLRVLNGDLTPKSPLPLGCQGPHLTQCVVGPREKGSKSVERFKQGARM